LGKGVSFKESREIGFISDEEKYATEQCGVLQKNQSSWEG
jgi:hypothetical protein